MPNVMQQLFVMNIESLLREYAAYRAFNKSDAVINMRIPRPILDRLKELAAAQHVPYQSLFRLYCFHWRIPKTTTNNKYKGVNNV